eukprot:3607049-Rhodomonas_salina.2
MGTFLRLASSLSGNSVRRTCDLEGAKTDVAQREFKKTGVSEEALSELEQRLGSGPLPPSLCEFLRYSDGWGRIGFEVPGKPPPPRKYIRQAAFLLRNVLKRCCFGLGFRGVVMRARNRCGGTVCGGADAVYGATLSVVLTQRIVLRMRGTEAAYGATQPVVLTQRAQY